MVPLPDLAGGTSGSGSGPPAPLWASVLVTGGGGVTTASTSPRRVASPSILPVAPVPVPLVPDPVPDLSGKRVFLAAGRADPIVPRENVERLAGMLKTAGADVTLSAHARGHQLEPDDVGLAREWLGRAS